MGQSLIKNGDFETSPNDSRIELNLYNNFTCDFWGSATLKGTPDYFSSKRTGNYSVPGNRWGFMKAYSGNCYVGIGVNYGGTEMYEYLQTKISQPLIKGMYYRLCFYISIANSRNFTTNEMDFYFTNTELRFNTDKIIRIENYERITLPKTYFKANEWTKISSCYLANGQEKYLVIGMLNPKHKLISLNNPPKDYNGMYFYIDSVSLIPIENNFLCNYVYESKSNIDSSSFPVNKNFSLKNIQFEVNQSILRKGSESELKNLAAFLNKNLDYKIELTGYTDDSGNENENIKLSEYRAKAVSDYLKSQGISDNRIHCIGLGSKHPIQSFDSHESKAINRRVECKIINK